MTREITLPNEAQKAFQTLITEHTISNLSTATIFGIKVQVTDNATEERIDLLQRADLADDLRTRKTADGKIYLTSCSPSSQKITVIFPIAGTKTYDVSRKGSPFDFKEGNETVRVYRRNDEAWITARDAAIPLLSPIAQGVAGELKAMLAADEVSDNTGTFDPEAVPSTSSPDVESQPSPTSPQFACEVGCEGAVFTSPQALNGHRRSNAHAAKVSEASTAKAGS